MIRRMIAIAITAMLAFALLPTAAASAAVSGRADLVGPTDAFPGATDFTVRVTNNNASLLGLTGTRVNAVRVFLPRQVGVTTAAGTPTVPSGWEAFRQDSGNLQVWNFSTDNGGIAAGGGTGDFTFPTEILPPSNGDRTAEFLVVGSDDGGATFSDLDGDLDAVIRVLQIVPDSLRPLAPGPSGDFVQGVTDGTGTAGQDITYGFRVRNFAQQAIAVTPDLSASGPETVGDADPVTVGGLGGEAEVVVPVTLGAQSSGQRTTTFTAEAGSANAQAVGDARDFVVQAAPRITLQANSFRDEVQNREARYVNDRTTYEFAIDATKTNPPALRLDGIDLTFADTQTDLAGPVTFGGGGNSGTLAYQPTLVSGPDGEHDATFSFSGVDINGAPLTQSDITINDLIVIDTISPLLDLVLSIPNGQTAAKNGDSVEISGTIDDASPTEIDIVQIISDNGDLQDVEVSRSGNSFSGTATLAFDVPTRDEVLAAGDLPFVFDFNSFAQATDAADNVGSAVSDSERFDNFAPLLLDPARTLQLPAIDSKPVIEVEIFEQTDLRGGCNPLLWRVDGQAAVSSVRYSNGENCFTSSDDPGDNIRILRLSSEIDRFATPSVEYIPQQLPGFDRLADGANNFSPRQVIDTISGIVPLPPRIVEVTREGGSEVATFDEDTYWVRTGGNDPVVTVAGARAGDLFEVLDQNGNVLGTVQAGGNEVAASLRIGASDGLYVRSLRLRNSAGASDLTSLDVVLDTVAPGIASVVRSDTEEVTVTFDEPILTGSDFADSWQVWETVENQDGSSGTDQRFYPVRSVSGEREERRLEVRLQDRGPLGGVIYEFMNFGSNAQRYEDRAGNLLADLAATS